MSSHTNDYYNHLYRNLEMLIEKGRIGLSRISPDDLQGRNIKQTELKEWKNYPNNFYINVPFAGDVLNWEMIFDPEDFSEPPDFVFNDYSFLPDPDIDYIADNIPSWNSWDLTNSESVYSILKEFLALYKKTQVEKLMELEQYDDLKKQYEEVLQILNVSPDQVEIRVDPKSELEQNEVGDDFSSAAFLIDLPIDFTQLPEYCLEESGSLLNTGEDFAHLTIQLKKQNNSQTKVGLTLGAKIESAIGKVKLPKLGKHITIGEIALSVKEAIEKQIKFISEQYKARNRFISAIIDSFSSSIVEYDANRLFKICFIFEDGEDYECLVIVQLGGKFPQDRPKVQVQSLYCQFNKTCMMPIIFHNYNPSLSEEENVSSLREILQGDVKMFQKHKH